MSSSLDKDHRYSAWIISHCVWLYHRFPLSFREVEEMMMAGGVGGRKLPQPTRHQERGMKNFTLPWALSSYPASARADAPEQLGQLGQIIDTGHVVRHLLEDVEVVQESER